MLRLTESNRLEALADRLVAALDVRSDTPLVPETVVVPNFGMARWLSLAIARAHGICANVRFDLPAKFVWDVLARVVGLRAEVDVFDPTVLGWRVFDALGNLEPGPRFAALEQYVGAPSDRPRYELARRIAGVFEVEGRGFVATDLDDEDRWVSVRGRFEARGDSTITAIQTASASIQATRN